jgi:hypothetical protein
MEKKSVGLLELETAVLECFLEKTPLSPLGVNRSFEIEIYIYINTCFKVKKLYALRTYFDKYFYLKLHSPYMLIHNISL